MTHAYLGEERDLRRLVDDASSLSAVVARQFKIAGHPDLPGLGTSDPASHARKIAPSGKKSVAGCACEWSGVSVGGVSTPNATRYLLERSWGQERSDNMAER